MTANIITLARLFLTFLIITLFGKNISIDTAVIVTIPHLETIQTGTHILATTAVVICLLRGVPVLMDGITHIQPAQKHHISS